MTHSSAVHARRVELGPPLPAYQVEGVLQGPRVAVDTVREECIEDVADGEDPGLDVEVWSAQRTVSMLGLLAACAVVPGAVVHFFGETEVQISGTVHFLPIAVSAGLAAAAAVALTVAGARRGDARSVLIGTAFSSMAALLSIHGLMTIGHGSAALKARYARGNRLRGRGPARRRRRPPGPPGAAAHA